MKIPKAADPRIKAQLAAERDIQRGYPDCQNFVARPGVKFGEGDLFFIDYKDGSGDDWETYVYSEGGKYTQYDDLNLLVATQLKTVDQGSSLDLVRVAGLIGIAVLILAAVVFRGLDDKTSTAMVGMLGIAIGYVAGDRTSGYRPKV